VSNSPRRQAFVDSGPIPSRAWGIAGADAGQLTNCAWTQLLSGHRIDGDAGVLAPLPARDLLTAWQKCSTPHGDTGLEPASCWPGTAR